MPASPLDALRGIVGPAHVLTGVDCGPYVVDGRTPEAVALPGSKEEVAAVLLAALSAGLLVAIPGLARAEGFFDFLFGGFHERPAPPPQVNSAVVRMLPRPQAQLTAASQAGLEQVVRRAFGQRRKTLRNSLAGLLEAEDYAALGIAPGLRAENLAVADFVAISNYLAQKEKS